MRNVVVGFALGYYMIAFLVVPPVLCALELAPNCAGGVVMVLDRNGLLAPIRSYVAQATHFRDRTLSDLSENLAIKLFPRIPD